MSFGINEDATFDIEMRSKFLCQVDSFDPYIVNDLFNKTGFENALTVRMDDKWRFHKMGITGSRDFVIKKNRIGWIAKLEDILNYTTLTNKVIDVFKMDIENGEWSVLIHLDIDYACEYFKQFILETHTSKINSRTFNQNKDFNPLNALRRLEKCFLLFHRDTRFYSSSQMDRYGFDETEFQNHKKFKLDLYEFKDEIELFEFMITFGELYFLNKRFLGN